MTSRYKNDPVFREKALAASRARYHRLKAEKLAQQINGNSNESSSVMSEPSTEPSTEQEQEIIEETGSVKSQQNNYEQRINDLENQVRILKQTNRDMIVKMRDFFNMMLEQQEDKPNETPSSNKIYSTNDVIDIINKNDALRPKTKKSYISNFNVIRSNIAKDETNVCFLKNVESVLSFINTHYGDNVSSKTTSVSSLIFILRSIDIGDDIIAKYNDAMMNYKSQRNMEREKNKATKTHFKWEDLRKAYYDKKGTFKDKDTQLVAALYIERPPLRSEWARSVMITDDLTKYPNAIRLDGERIFLRLSDYKNSDHNGVYEYEFSIGDLRNLVKDQILERGLGNTFLNYGVRALQDRVKNIINDLIGIDYCGIQELRRSYETYLQSSPEYTNANIQEQNRMHADLLHSYDIAREYKRVEETNE